MDGTVIQQGKFTSDGSSKFLNIRSDVDWMEIINYTQSATTQTTGRGVMFRWQRGMADAAGIMYTKQDSANALDLEVITAGGFTLLDTSDKTLGALNATGSGVTAASPAVVSATSTAGLAAGDVVRMYNVAGMQQIAGMDFTLGTVTTNTSFQLVHLDASGFAAAGTTCSFRKVPFQPMFYPRARYITKVTKAASAVITLSVTHGYNVDDVVKFVVPSEFGMVELDGVQGKVTAISTANNTITVNVDSTAFTTFAFPTSAIAAAGVTFAQVIPVGSEGTNSVEAATDNVDYIGMSLGAGADAPAGSSSDVIYWRAGKSLIVDNE